MELDKARIQRITQVLDKIDTDKDGEIRLDAVLKVYFIVVICYAVFVIYLFLIYVLLIFTSKSLKNIVFALFFLAFTTVLSISDTIC